MDLARAEARKGAPEGTSILTGKQSQGRGRIKRTWFTPEGNIALSVILYPDARSLPAMIMLAALAVARSIERITGLRPDIKWPNDVLIGGKKVCGILTESDVRTNRVAYVVIGIGINIELRLDAMPDIVETATSLNKETGGKVSRLELLRSLLEEMDALYLSPLATVYAEWRRRLVTLGKRVRVASGEGVIEGTAETVAEDGSLLLRLDDGSVRHIVAGDVTVRDAAQKE